MNIDLNVLVTFLLGAGGTGALAGIINVVKTIRGGKIENEENLIKRLDTDNRKQQELREAAEERAEEAEKEAEEYRKKRNEALERTARLRLFIINNNLEPPTFGDDNER